MSKKRVIVIGGGFGGLAAACLLAKDGHEVTVLEKNAQLGGRAGLLETNGFVFDTGPSWYLMPDVFERFFQLLDEDIAEHLDLVRLSPSYRVYFKDLDQHVDLTGDLDTDATTFEAIEPGAGTQLRKYLDISRFTYETAVGKFLNKNYDSPIDLLTPDLLKNAHKLHVFSNMDRYVRKFFKDPRLQKIMQYPLVFLGSSPYNAPALYNLMSHVDFNQGVFYPMGGMYKVVEALINIGAKYGVTYQTNAPVEQIIVEDGRAAGVVSNGVELRADVVISDADLHHTEQALLQPGQRDHSEKYWQKRVLSPSALLMYLGVDAQYDSLLHHTLLFSKDWKQNFGEIFDNPRFPTDPSIYICNPNKTDPSVAPKGTENIFVLVPLAAGLDYTEAELETFADKILSTMERELSLTNLQQKIIYKKLYCVKDFQTDYNSFKGTGLGLAHTLFQTAIFRPSNKSRKVKDLYYVGANVHPGIGLPVCLISAELAANRLKK